MMDYPVVITPLSEEDGGGYLAYFPDLVGCMSDGETPDEALANGLLAFDEWMDAAKERGITIPKPHSAAERAAKEWDGIVSAVLQMRDQNEALDARLDELQRRIVEVEEQIAHSEAWARFGTITGQSLQIYAHHRALLSRD